MEKALEILKHYHNLCSQLFVQTGDEEYRDEYVKINEAIAELEKAMKPKTCDTCTYFDNELWGGNCLNFGFRCTSAGAEAHRPDDGFCCNRYKSKDS